MNNSPFSFLKKNKATILLVIGFSIGLVIFLYPLVSRYYAAYNQTQVIDVYQESLNSLNEEDLQKQKEVVEEYNASLTGSTTEVKDPFANTSGTTEVEAASFNSSINIFTEHLGKTIGHIDIPSIDAHLPIYEGTSDDVLQKGIGWLENTSFPMGGTGTHSVLTGHRGLPSSKLFSDLPEMKIGDVFYIHVLGEVFAYEVDHTVVVLPHETEYIAIEEGEDLVTLITCTPYMINTHRLLVRGTRIPYEPPKEALTTPADNNPTTFYLVLIASAVSGVIILSRRRQQKGGSA